MFNELQLLPREKVEKEKMISALRKQNQHLRQTIQDYTSALSRCLTILEQTRKWNGHMSAYFLFLRLPAWCPSHAAQPDCDWKEWSSEPKLHSSLCCSMNHCIELGNALRRCVRPPKWREREIVSLISRTLNRIGRKYRLQDGQMSSLASWSPRLIESL